MNVSASRIRSMWFGQSSKIARAVFTLARKLQPCIIFFGKLPKRVSWNSACALQTRSTVLCLLGAFTTTTLPQLSKANCCKDGMACRRRNARRLSSSAPPTEEMCWIPRFVVDSRYTTRYLSNSAQQCVSRYYLKMPLPDKAHRLVILRGLLEKHQNVVSKQREGEDVFAPNVLSQAYASVHTAARLQ